MATTESKAINEAIFASLAEDRESRATDAISAFTRDRMFHRFTGRPRRGYMHRIMPAVHILPVAELQRRGWPYRQDHVYDLEGVLHACHAFDGGDLYYEVVEERLQKQDYQQRLAKRHVPRWEWEWASHSQRWLAWYHSTRPEEQPTRQEKHAYFEKLMCEILSQITQIGGELCSQLTGGVS